MGEFALGQPVPRTEDPRLLRGGGRYVDDLQLPGMLYGVVVRSPHAHARILGIDTARARKAPGVHAVLTGEDWAASGFGDLPVPSGQKKRDGSPMYRPPFPALTRDKVRWVGDYVAFVVAETQAQALDAAELVDVEYELLPAVTATADITAPGAQRVWDDCPDNICFVHQEGDKAATDAAIAKADRVIKHRFVINRVTAATMEPRGSVGIYDVGSDRYTVHTTLQRPHSFRRQLANTLKISESKLRVVAIDIGGSFGMKSAVYNEVALVLFASRILRRPVKWTSTRSEAFLADAQGRDNVTEAELGLDKDGKFLGMRVRMICNVGSYLQVGGEATAISNLGTMAGVYTTPAMHVDVTAAFSHTHPMRPYRGNGRPEAAFVIERMIDLAADELGLDPVEIRRRNIIPDAALPYRTPLNFLYDSGTFEKSMDMALEMGDWAGFPARRAAAAARGKLAGIGVSNSIEKAASPGIEGAEIRFDRSGTVTLLCGASNHGQGHETILTQLICERLGVSPDIVQYVSGDTDAVFYGEGTGGSRTATIAGAAVEMATVKIIAKATELANFLLEVDDAEFTEGVFRSRKTNRSLTMVDVAKAASNPDKLPAGMEPGLTATAVYNHKKTNYPNGCHVCEVEIDPDTGVVDILRYNVVDDVGTVLNPLLLKGQIIGGIAQGVGQVLMEDIRFDPESGQLLTGSFQDYAMPHAHHFPHITVKANPSPTKTNPLGVKGAGEAGCVGALPALANAIVDALSHLGVRDIQMPATPERVWQVIQAAKKNKAA